MNPPTPTAQSGATDFLLQMVPIAADHPAFAGHFPGRPIVPGVVLLDQVIIAVRQWRATPETDTVEIANAKFLSPVGPGEELQLECRWQAGAGFATVRFELACGARKIASGSLRLHPHRPDAAAESTGDD